MSINSRAEEILEEQFFPYIGMSLEERNYYLNIIRNCKDVCDTENKVCNKSKSRIVEMHFKKQNNVVDFNGSLTIEANQIRENRCIEGKMYLEKSSIIVDYKITRLCVEQGPKEYRVFDEFKLENNILKRKSLYNYNIKSICDEIDNEEMKGKLK